MKTKILPIVAVAGLAAVGLVSTPAAATANSPFGVDTAADTADVAPGDGICADADGNCSLRAAVQEANATDGADVIKLGATTYTLTLGGASEDAAATGDLDVTDDLSIVGRRSVVELIGLGDRGFDVFAGTRLEVSHLTVQNGAPPETESGGAFRSAGALDLDRVVATANVVVGDGASGGAVVNDGGALTVRFSDLTANTAARAGGAIEAVGGTTVVESSRLESNATGPLPGNGGGLHLTGAGEVVIVKSTVGANSATNEGGGLWNSAAGVMSVDRSVVRDNTVTGDQSDSGGGGIFNQGDETNTGGGTLTVVGTRISGNTAVVGSASGGGILNEAGTLTVQQSAIEANRAARAGGAIEAVAGATVVDRVTMRDNVAGPTPGNGGALHLTGAGTVDVTRSNVIDNVATAEGGGLWNSATGTMTVDKTLFRGNSANGIDADQGGGALFNDGGSLAVDRSTITRNTATAGSGSGGGILNLGHLSVTSTTLKANTSARAGGAIETSGGTVSIVASGMLNNVTGPNPGNGGGLHVSGAATVSIDRSSVTANTAANEGGGLWNSAVGTMSVTGSFVTHNVANGDLADEGGGGIFNQGAADGSGGGVLTIDATTIRDNAAVVGSGSGGGILNERGQVTVTDSVIDRNRSARAGGGVEVVGGDTDMVGTTTLSGVRLSNNRTGANPGNGGGLHVTAAGEVVIDDGAIFGNFADNEGGGVWNSPSGVVTITDTRINHNRVGVVANGPNVFQKGPIMGGLMTVDGQTVMVGPNNLFFI